MSAGILAHYVRRNIEFFDGEHWLPGRGVKVAYVHGRFKLLIRTGGRYAYVSEPGMVRFAEKGAA